MPRSITIDDVEVTQVRLVKASDGALRVFCEYRLLSAGQAILAKHMEVTDQLAVAPKATVASLFGTVSQGVAAIELA